MKNNIALAIALTVLVVVGCGLQEPDEGSLYINDLDRALNRWGEEVDECRETLDVVCQEQALRKLIDAMDKGVTASMISIKDEHEELRLALIDMLAIYGLDPNRLTRSDQSAIIKASNRVGDAAVRWAEASERYR